MGKTYGHFRQAERYTWDRWSRSHKSDRPWLNSDQAVRIDGRLRLPRSWSHAKALGVRRREKETPAQPVDRVVALAETQSKFLRIRWATPTDEVWEVQDRRRSRLFRRQSRQVAGEGEDEDEDEDEGE